MESFGGRLKKYREKAGKSQQELAEALNITRSGYQMIENGRNGKKFSYLPGLAKALNCTIDDLFPEMDEKSASADAFDAEDMKGWER